MDVSILEKDLEKILNDSPSLFSCSNLLRRISLKSTGSYPEMLQAVRLAVADDKAVFSWRGIKRKIDNGKRYNSGNAIDSQTNLKKKLSKEARSLLGYSEDDLGNITALKTLNWEDFRKFVKYLIESVQQEAGAVAAQKGEMEGDEFIFLQKYGDWIPSIKRPFTGFFPIRAEYTSLLTRLATIQPGTPLVFGYPVDISYDTSTHEDIPPTQRVRPVFQINVTYDPRRRCFFSSNPQPQVNLSWLSARLKNAGRKEAFLASCGFVDIEADTLVSTAQSSLSLPHLVSTLSALLSDSIQEPLLIQNVPDTTLRDVSPGIYNRAVLMLGRHPRYVKTMLSELSYIANRPEEELEGTALGAFFSGTGQYIVQKLLPNHAGTLLDSLPLNLEQRNAVASLQNARLSVITGPPGTGKSQVAAATMAGLRLRGRSTLFTSRNHKAIDAVMGRMKVEDGSPYVIRANDKNDPNLKITFRKMARVLLQGSVDQNAEKKRTDLLKRADELLQIRGERAAMMDRLEDLKASSSNYEEDISLHSSFLPNEMLVAIGCIKKSMLHSLCLDIEHVLNSSSQGTRFERIHVWGRIILAQFRSRLQGRRLRGLGPLIWSMSFGRGLAVENAQTLLRHILIYTRALRNANDLADQIRILPKIDGITDEIAELSANIQKITCQALPQDLQARGSGIRSGAERQTIANLNALLRNMASGMLGHGPDTMTLTQLKQSTQCLLLHCPCWAVTNLSVGSRIPLVAGMFDLAMIDEASQCDIASAIPVLFRARRAGIIGDPYQLRHIAKMDAGRDLLIRKRTGFSEPAMARFSYAESSLYDFCADSSHVSPIFLSETYRSHIDIAEYSNDLFYDNRLRVAVDPASLHCPSKMKLGLHWTPVEGIVARVGPSGCYCPEECAVVVQLLMELIQDGFRGTVGVVTPFRQQANRINDALYEEGVIQKAREEMRLHVDTAHGFQGDERDVMLFSLCAGPEMPRGSLHFLKDQGYLFNVAASRARAVLHIVGNKKWASSCGIEHIERLTRGRSHSETKQSKGPWAPHDSPWEKILFDALVAQGLEPIPQYPLAGRRLDMALVRSGKFSLKLDIEVDGESYHRNPDGSRKKDDLWRDLQLKGLGWKIKRFWVYMLRENIDECVKSILKIWGEADDNNKH